MKQKAGAGEKAGAEIQKMQQMLSKEKELRQTAISANERSQRYISDSKEKIKQMNDQIGSLDDSLAASEYQCQGL